MNTPLRSRKFEAIAVGGALIQAAAAIAMSILAYWTGIPVLGLIAAYAGIGVVVWILTFLHLYQIRMTVQEQDETTALHHDESALFEESGGSLLSAERKLKQMEKWFFPGVVSAVGIGLGVVALIFFNKAVQYRYMIDSARVMPAIVTLAIITFVAFISGRFVAGLARSESDSYRFKGASGYVLSSAFFALLCAVSLVLFHFGYAWALKAVHFLIPAIFLLIAADYLIHIVMDYYRPRIAGQLERPAYQNFVIALFAEPQNITRAVAHTLDYQFGFKLSETWFYQFVEKILAPLALFQLLALYLMTCVVVIQPHQSGVVERFGAPQYARGVLEPGIQFKLPWPIEKVRIVETERILSVYINHHNINDKVILWSISHHTDRKMILIPSRESDNDSSGGVPVNWIMVSGEIQYRVKDPFAYLYTIKNPQELISNIGWRHLVSITSTTDIFDLFGPQRLALSTKLHSEVQQHLDRLNTGIEVVFVGIHDMHPPAEVSPAFEAVVESLEEKQTKILAAQTYADQILPRAAADAKQMVFEARSYAVEQKLLSEAEAEQFKQQSAAYRTAPVTYTWRTYLVTLRRALSSAKKIIVSSALKLDETHVIDLKDKAAAGLLDLNLSNTGGE